MDDQSLQLHGRHGRFRRGDGGHRLYDAGLAGARRCRICRRLADDCSGQRRVSGLQLPAGRLFLGDTGSTALGFLAAAGSLWGSQAGLFPFWAALWVFSPFIVDATVTLLRRLVCGERIWEAHRSHYYQRLVLLGWGHRRTVLAEYVLMLACAGGTCWRSTSRPTGPPAGSRRVGRLRPVDGGSGLAGESSPAAIKHGSRSPSFQTVGGVRHKTECSLCG